ncbi:MAG: LysM peptidoglycan-binding domain-containing protein [Lentisphaerae bacterium]|nr:LysM peptidoglycan-binding domain-containing protein [Lentisphaerota bacterium]
MNMTSMLRGAVWLTVWAVSLMAPACSQNIQELESQENRDPFIRKALWMAGQGDQDGAIETLNEALGKNPQLARAHFELAWKYIDIKKDPVRAIYHYQRYLEMRPGTQKRRMIEDAIAKARLSLMAQLSDSPPNLDEKVRALQEENAQLKASLREVRENLARQMALSGGSGRRSESAGGTGTVGVVKTPAPPVSPHPPATHRAQPPPILREIGVGESGRAGEPETYVVQARDTLLTIAARMYQDTSQWKRILDANREQLPDAGKLRVGQVLVIPR